MLSVSIRFTLCSQRDIQLWVFQIDLKVDHNVLHQEYEVRFRRLIGWITLDYNNEYPLCKRELALPGSECN